MPNTFDLRSVIAEVPDAEDTVEFTFDLKLAHKVKDFRSLPDIDETVLAEAEAELKAKTYTAELMSVPRRRREDIYAEALTKFTGTRDFLGRVDETTEFNRNLFVRVSIVAAAIKRIISPDSGVQEEEIFEAVEMIYKDAPDQIFTTLENAVNELNKTEDEQDALHKSADF